MTRAEASCEICNVVLVAVESDKDFDLSTVKCGRFPEHPVQVTHWKLEEPSHP